MKYVLVTGAFGGMGRACVQALAEKGYGVFALDAKVGEKKLANVIPLEADITNEEALITAAGKVKSVTGELCAILHFAGIYMLDSLVEIDNARFEKIFRVNLLGAYLVNKTFLPFLTKNSRILIITSELAPLDPLPFTGIYAISKTALDKYAYSLRMELQLLGIKVSVLRAGAVQTDMLSVSTSELDTFCAKTKRYTPNAGRFRRIVERVEAKSIPTARLAQKAVAIMEKKHPRFVYSINRNPLLLLMNVLPKSTQLWAIRMILKS